MVVTIGSKILSIKISDFHNEKKIFSYTVLTNKLLKKKKRLCLFQVATEFWSVLARQLRKVATVLALSCLPTHQSAWNTTIAPTYTFFLCTLHKKYTICEEVSTYEQQWITNLWKCPFYIPGATKHPFQLHPQLAQC